MAICTPILGVKPLVSVEDQLQWSPGKPSTWCRLLPGGKPATWNAFIHFLVRDSREVILFVHGYDQTPQRVAENAVALQRMADEFFPDAFTVVPFAWECRARPWSKLLDYLRDKKRSVEGAKALSEILHFISGPRVHVLAHSMGGRVWRETVAQMKEPPELASLSLVAADIPWWDLCAWRPSFRMAKNQRTLVATNVTDRALRWSGRLPVNGFVPRLGAAKNPPSGKTVRVWRCDELANQADVLGHSYFFGDNEASRQVFRGILNFMRGGNPCD